MDVLLIRTADADVKNYADVPLMRLQMRISDTFLTHIHTQLSMYVSVHMSIYVFMSSTYDDLEVVVKPF